MRPVGTGPGVATDFPLRVPAADHTIEQGAPAEVFESTTHEQSGFKVHGTPVRGWKAWAVTLPLVAATAAAGWLAGTVAGPLVGIAVGVHQAVKGYQAGIADPQVRFGKHEFNLTGGIKEAHAVASGLLRGGVCAAIGVHVGGQIAGGCAGVYLGGRWAASLINRFHLSE